MLRVASVISVILVSTLAGCRSVPPMSVGESRSRTVAAHRTLTPTMEKPQSNEHLASFVQEAEETDKTARQSELTELMSSAMPDERRDSPLTLADLEGIAFQNNPTLAAAAARIDVARGRQVQAGLYPNPVVGYHATEIGNLGTAGQQGGFISQRFITGGKLRLDQAIAGKEINEAHFRFHAQEQRVLSDVRVSFYNALVAQRRLELTKELAGIGDNLVKATEKLLKGRLGTENDLLQAEIRADEAYILFDNAQNQHVELWRRLVAVIAVPTMPMKTLDCQLDADLPNYEWDDCYKMVLDSNPELNAALARVERTSLAIHRAKKEPIPNVDLSVSVRHHNVTDSDVVNVQLGIPIPIFNKNQGNIRSAEAEWVTANNEVKRIELELQDRLAVTYRRYANARQQVERYSQRMVPRAKRSLQLVTNAYEKGQVEYLTLLTAQQTYLEVSLSYLDSMQELRTSLAVIEGQLLIGSLTVRE